MAAPLESLTVPEISEVAAFCEKTLAHTAIKAIDVLKINFINPFCRKMENTRALGAILSTGSRLGQAAPRRCRGKVEMSPFPAK
jgi:hypothetical protein